MDAKEKDGLIQSALALGAGDRLLLASRLLDSVRVKDTDTDAVVDCALTACGVETMDYTSHQQDMVAARCIIAYALTRMDVPIRTIAAVIHKDRTSAIYCRKRMQDALNYPGSFPGMLHRYAKFNQLIYERTSDKRTA